MKAAAFAWMSIIVVAGCTDLNRLSSHEGESTAASAWYLGCYADGEDRALPHYAGYRDDMTPAVCQSLCSGYQHAGVQWFGECWCGDDLRWSALPEEACNTPCTGDAGATCGGGWANSVYTVPAYEGCFTDAEARALPAFAGYADDMTPAKCQALCRASDYRYAGAQWYGECWCGNDLGYNQVSDAACDTPCTGDATQRCGGGWHNSIYSVGPSDADERLNAAERQSLCAQMCNHDLVCFGDNPSGCLADCAIEAQSFARGPTYDFLGCLDSSCSSVEDHCLLSQPVRAIDAEYAASCAEYFGRCGVHHAGLCDIGDAAAGAEIRLYRGAFVAGYIACFASPCGELDACVDALKGL